MHFKGLSAPETRLLQPLAGKGDDGKSDAAGASFGAAVKVFVTNRNPAGGNGYIVLCCFHGFDFKQSNATAGP